MKRFELMYKSFSHYFISAVVYWRLFREFLRFIFEGQVDVCLFFLFTLTGQRHVYSKHACYCHNLLAYSPVSNECINHTI